MAYTDIAGQCAAAGAAAKTLASAGADVKNRALDAVAQALTQDAERVLDANRADVEAARKSGMSAAMLDRLTLDPGRIAGIAGGVREIALLPDPVGKSDGTTKTPDGLMIERRRVPLGVICAIYESRPNVTVDIAALCLKSGNSAILRGGKEAFNSNLALTGVLRSAISGAGLPEDCVSLVTDTSRESVDTLMSMTGRIDLLIPRGGAGLINHVVSNSKVPVIQTGVGNCHVYVESSADLNMAANIIFNAKCSRPSVCNAAETLLVDRSVAADFLPLAKALLDTKNVELRGCPETCSVIPSAVPARDEDYYTEFLDFILAVKVVGGIDEAIAHIGKYGTAHSDAIVTDNYTLAQRFLDEVDSAAVYVNASTRFTDGGVFGLGAEIGISTQKLHARGPLGVEHLTSIKYVIRGSGQIR
ncbi:MAG: glutamate-5-semialdehyde dehydrogenase [Oscillospiraceae bacterium]|jgi:glutamate-5-semialdehyde dehydrogenase|nr:glutamate-5-semialdehyde dehydrogenase [Oscillospiraceae bacterium]